MSRGSFGSFGNNGVEEGFSSYHNAGGRDSQSEYSRLTANISSNIQKITNNVSQVQRMSNQIGTPSDSEKLREELHQIEHYTNQLAKETNGLLKEVTRLPQPTAASEQRQKKLQMERFTDDFTAALNKFQHSLRHAAQKEKDSVARARANSGLMSSRLRGPNDKGPYSDERQSPDALIDIKSPPSAQSQILMEEDVNLELIKEREEAIRKLEADIVGVNDIFKELGMLVHEQGEVIDSIEANIESAHIHVQEGGQQLEKARDYQTSARKKKLCLLIIGVVILVVVIIILAVVLSPRSSN